MDDTTRILGHMAQTIVPIVDRVVGVTPDLRGFGPQMPQLRKLADDLKSRIQEDANPPVEDALMALAQRVAALEKRATDAEKRATDAEKAVAPRSGPQPGQPEHELPDPGAGQDKAPPDKKSKG